MLPFGHSRHYPLSFNYKTKEIISGDLNFFNSVLHKNFEPSNFISPNLCELQLNKTKNAIIILNILDNCFGHSLLKLFFSIKYIQDKKSDYDFLLIVPKALKHFVKDTISFNTLFIDLAFSQFEKCYVLNQEISIATKNYDQVYIAGAETYESFDLKELKEKLNLFGKNNISEAKSNIIFYYRKDYHRTWAGNTQKNRIINLFNFLRIFFSNSVQFYVIGDRDTQKFPEWIKDVRTNNFSDQTDFYYNTLLNSCLICVGLTGSHMLFPSMLSLCTVHLHPSFKHKNMAEDIISGIAKNEVLSAYKHLYYYGNHNCSNIKAKELGSLILTHFQGLIEKEFKIESKSTGQSKWINDNYPQFNYHLAKEFRIKENKKLNRKILMQRLVDKFS